VHIQFTAFINSLDGTEGTLRWFVDDTRLQRAVSELESRTVVERDLEKWADGNPTEFPSGQGKIWPQECRTGWGHPAAEQADTKQP